MRPRRFGRGERPSRPLPIRAYRTFNAATAFRPWRTHRVDAAGGGAARLQCGHGVSAVENHGRLGRRPGGRRPPSMRPRRFGRGEPRPRSARRRVRGPFNAATAFRPWRTHDTRNGCPLTGVLQCGHGVSAVENAAVGRPGGGPRGPSMRPRRFGRGELPAAAAVLGTAAAPSMRPRRFGRGEHLHLGPEELAAELLQCGHGVSAVENPTRHRRSTPSLMPSMRPRRFGRGEQDTVTWQTSNSRSFNAATAFRPWRT